jgi:hypothetical protein
MRAAALPAAASPRLARPAARAARRTRAAATPTAARCVAADAPSRRALLAAAALLAGAPPACAVVPIVDSRAAFTTLLAEKIAGQPLDHRACMRLLFNDVASGGHNGSVHFRHACARDALRAAAR